MNRIAIAASVPLLATSFVAPAAVAVDVADLVPENTVLYVGTDDLGAVWERAMDTRLRRAWNAEPVAEMRTMAHEQWRAMMSQMTGGAAEGVEDIPWPTGQVAMSVSALRDDETGLFEPSLLFMADFGENAPALEVLFGRAIEAIEDQQGDVERLEILGREAFLIEDPDADADEEDIPDDPFADFDEPVNPASEALSQMVVLREGSWLMLSSHGEQLARVLGAIDTGEGRGFAMRDDVAAVNGLLGGDEGAAVRAMFLVRDLQSIVGALDPGGMSMMMAPMITQYLGDVDGLGMSMDMGRAAMMDQRLAIWMPNGRTGLSRLVSEPGPRSAVPSFVPADALSYGSMNFDMPGFGQLAQQLAGMAMMFMDGGGMDGPDLGEINRMIADVTGAFGKRMHFVSYAGGMAEGGLAHLVTALETTRADTIDNYLSQYGAGMGVEPRDFAGSRIFTMDMAGMMPPGGMVPGMGGMGGGEMSMSVGLGGGMAFMGATDGVQRMLRSLGDDAAGLLEETDGFERVAAYLGGDDIVAWGWSDTARQIATQMRTTIAQMEMQQAQMREMLEAMGEDPGAMGDMDDMVGPMGGMLEFMKSMDADTLGEVLGPAAWVVRSNDQGFVIRSVVTESTSE